jgi:hypothetical protein
VNPLPRSLRFAAWVITSPEPQYALLAWAHRAVLRRTPTLSDLPMPELRQLITEGGIGRSLVLCSAPAGTTPQTV